LVLLLNKINDGERKRHRKNLLTAGDLKLKKQLPTLKYLENL